MSIQADVSNAGEPVSSHEGTENLPIVMPLSGIPLPPTARLSLQRTAWTLREPLEYINVSTISAGKQGLIFMVGFAVEAKPVGGTAVGGGYIEGCWQFYRQAAEQFPGLVVGTGLEDYFDSSFYFGADTALQRGVPFTNAVAGVPYFNRDGLVERISAYRSHATDPLVFTDGGRLVWRVGEGHQPMAGGGDGVAGTMPRVYTKCGNQYPSTTASKSAARTPLGNATSSSAITPPPRQISAVNVSTYSWTYVW